MGVSQTKEEGNGIKAGRKSSKHNGTERDRARKSCKIRNSFFEHYATNFKLEEMRWERNYYLIGAEKSSPERKTTDQE